MSTSIGPRLPSLPPQAEITGRGVVAQKADTKTKGVDVDLPPVSTRQMQDARIPKQSPMPPAEAKQLDAAISAFKAGDRNALHAFLSKPGAHAGAIAQQIRDRGIPMSTLFALGSRDAIITHYGPFLDTKERAKVMSTLCTVALNEQHAAQFSQTGESDVARVATATRQAYALLGSSPASETSRLIDQADKAHIGRDALLAFASTDPADVAMIKRLDAAYYETEIVGGRSLQTHSAMEMVRNFNGDDTAFREECAKHGVTLTDLYHLFATGETTAHLDQLLAAHSPASKAIRAQQLEAAGERFARNSPGSMDKAELQAWKETFHTLGAGSGQEEAARFLLADDGDRAKMIKSLHHPRVFARTVGPDSVAVVTGAEHVSSLASALDALSAYKHGATDLPTLVTVASFSHDAKAEFVVWLKRDAQLQGQLRHLVMDPNASKESAAQARGLLEQAGLPLNRSMAKEAEHERAFLAAFNKGDTVAMMKVPVSAALVDYAASLVEHATPKPKLNSLGADLHYRVEARLQLRKNNPSEALKQFDKLPAGPQRSAWETELLADLKLSPSLARAFYHTHDKLVAKAGVLEQTAREDALLRLRDALDQGNRKALGQIGIDASYALNAKAEAALAKEFARILEARGHSGWVDELVDAPSLKWQTKALLNDDPALFFSLRAQARQDGVEKSYDAATVTVLKANTKLRNALVEVWAKMSPSDPQMQVLGLVLRRAGFRSEGSMAASTGVNPATDTNDMR